MENERTTANIFRTVISVNRKLIFDFFIAVIIGIVCSFICLFALIQRNLFASDFQFPLDASRAIIAKDNPYTSVVPKGKYPFDQYFYYPIVASFVAIPLAGLPDQLAGAAFIGLSSGFLGYVLIKKERWRLGLLLSAPAFVTIYTAQWSFLIAAIVFIPSLQFLLICKPNIGTPGFFYKPTKIGIISIILGLLISIIIYPTWVIDWINTLGYTARYHLTPANSILIVFLVFCLLQYKKPEGRLLSVMLIAPQSMFFYDQLLLWLIPKTRVELWLMNILSWVGYILWRINLRGLPDTGQYVPSAYPFVLWLIYFPAIVILLFAHIKGAVKAIMIKLSAGKKKQIK